jgi:hypothetical protein
MGRRSPSSQTNQSPSRVHRGWALADAGTQPSATVTRANARYRPCATQPSYSMLSVLTLSLAAIPHWTLAYATTLDLTPAAHWPEPHVVTAPAR